MKYLYENNGITRTVTLDNHKVIDEHKQGNIISVIKEYNCYKNAKQYFEDIRETERRRGSQITLLEQGGNGHNFNKRNNHNHNVNIRHKVKIMGLPARMGVRE